MNEARRGWGTLSAFAEAAGVNLPALSLYVNGKRGLSVRVARAVLAKLETRGTSLTLDALLADGGRAKAA